MKNLVVMLGLFSCYEQTAFNREAFENKWWETNVYPVCFNLHESGDLLLYEESIRSEGSWAFCEPNEYFVGDNSFAVTEEEECWKIKGLKQDLVACECTLR
jgi:hypothetical protein